MMTRHPRRLSLPPLSMRLRLTLLYSAILALTLALCGAALYVTVAHINLDEAQQALATEANSLAAARHFSQGGLILPAYVVAAPDTYIQLRDPTGRRVTDQSGNLRAKHGMLPLSSSELQGLLQGNQTPPHVSTMGGEQVLVCDTLITIFGQRVVGVLQMARQLQDVYGALDALRPVLFLGGALVTLLAFGVSWLLAGTALRPIARITRTARAIGEAQDFDQRVAYTGPPDEVGRLATTFNAMLARLAEAYQTQRRFVADASHELRTPLTSIRGNVALLRREPPIAAADRVAILDDLDAESARMARLVGDLLTLARADAGRPLRRDPIPVTPLLAALPRRARALHPAHTVRVDSEPDVAVRGDPDALTQALLILLDNACKFTPPDGTITVTTAVAGDRVTIAVRDSGSGIAPEALPRVFERFYQGDASRAGAGAGLGLAIAQALVEGQGGEIDVESYAGAGSVFTVTLPRAVVGELAAAGEEALPPSGS
jgi:two-component system OmpR family sensor kinase